MRPRIRSVKPEMRQDERYGRLSYPARELFNGLITLADDEGRFLATTSTILGHVFPFDRDAPRRLKIWVNEVKASGMVVFYVADGVPYGAFRHWKRHQKINRPTASVLPKPPDSTIVAENGIGANVTEESVSDHGGLSVSRVGARSDPDPDQVVGLFEYWRGRCSKPRAKLTDERRAKLLARLREGYSVEEIRIGVDGAATNPPEDRDSGVVYDDLVSICRNGSQLERYIARATARPRNGNGRGHVETSAEYLARKGVGS